MPVEKTNIRCVQIGKENWCCVKKCSVKIDKKILLIGVKKHKGIIAIRLCAKYDAMYFKNKR